MKISGTTKRNRVKWSAKLRAYASNSLPSGTTAREAREDRNSYLTALAVEKASEKAT